MSAFVISKNHIQYLVNAGLSQNITRGFNLSWKGRYFLEVDYLNENPTANADRTGTMLWGENYKSINYLYNKNDTPPTYVHRLDEERLFDPVQVLKAIACYEYQSCEHPGWESSEARDFCETLRNAAISSLPGWDNALWAID